MRDIIIATVATSGQRDGAIRYWLSSGPGSLDLTPAASAQPGFFVMVFGRWRRKRPASAPVVEWDGQPIGDGRPGPVARALLTLLENDMRTGDRLIDVPY